MSRWKASVVMVLALPFAPSEARAWGNEGHRMVCEIAWLRLTPEARAFVRGIRQGDPAPGSSFARACTWADDVRDTPRFAHTSSYHFINIPAGQSGADLSRDCADPAKRCIPWAIEHYAGILTDASRSRRARAEALKFVGHFVGDLHQPLHAGRPGDLGGNRIFVNFFGTPDVKLHAVWDSRILARAGLSGAAGAASLNAGITDAEADAWTRPGTDVDLLAWTDESYRRCEDFVYGRLPANRRIRDGYYEPALEITREQVRKGGVRLADLLNRAAAGRLEFAE